MGVQIVHHKNNPFGLWVLFLRYIPKPMGEVLGRSPLGHRGLPPFAQGLKGHAKMRYPVTDIFIIIQGGPSLSRRVRLPRFPDQLPD